MGVMDQIRKRQSFMTNAPNVTPSKHEPELLYIGCVDARLDPIDDIGIPKGKALIYRNIAAWVPAPEADSNEALTKKGDVPQSVSIGATVEFFLHQLPALKDGQKKHIVIAGHTDCGGMKACCGDRHTKSADCSYLSRYLKAIKHLCTWFSGYPSAAHNHASLTALTEQSVCQSVKNLTAYPGVQKAIDDHLLEVHGWVIDTATRRIAELDKTTGHFKPMVGSPDIGQGSAL